MTIKISQLGTIGAVQGNTLIPVVANVAGTLTTVQANIDQLGNYIASGAYTYGNITATGNVTATSGNVWAKYIRTTPSTVTGLGYANVAGAGSRAFVTDADIRTWGNLYVGGAGNAVPVWSDGSNWYIG